jgi:hypothetical protein
MMKLISNFGISLLLARWVMQPYFAQGAVCEWKTLNQEAQELAILALEISIKWRPEEV